MPTLSWRFLCRTRTLPGFVFHVRSNVPPPSSSHPFKNIACHRFAPEDAFFNGDAPRATPRVLLVGKDRGGATLKVFLMRTVNETNYEGDDECNGGYAPLHWGVVLTTVV